MIESSENRTAFKNLIFLCDGDNENELFETYIFFKKKLCINIFAFS